MLQGKKTYVVGICGILFAIFGFASGHLDFITSSGFVFASLAAMGIRNGITTEVQSLPPSASSAVSAAVGAGTSAQ